jgi:hypothetical protein
MEIKYREIAGFFLGQTIKVEFIGSFGEAVLDLFNRSEIINLQGEFMKIKLGEFSSIYQDKWTEKDTDDKVHFSNKNFF